MIAAPTQCRLTAPPQPLERYSSSRTLSSRALRCPHSPDDANSRFGGSLSRAVRSVRCSYSGSRNNGDGNGSAAAALPAKAPNLKGAPVLELRVDDIRRPLARTRSNDPAKVQALMDSISEIGLQVPIDVLEVDGLYYGFSGCHRYEAHQRLGLEHIKCRVRKATRATLKMHMM